MVRYFHTWGKRSIKYSASEFLEFKVLLSYQKVIRLYTFFKSRHTRNQFKWGEDFRLDTRHKPVLSKAPKIQSWYMELSMLSSGGGSMKWKRSKSWTPRDFNSRTTLAKLVLWISGMVVVSISFLKALWVYSLFGRRRQRVMVKLVCLFLNWEDEICSYYVDTRH